MLTNGAEADGKAVWSWHPLLVSSWRRSCEPNRAFADRSFADDGGKTNSSPRRARNKPLKPLRRECRAIRCTPGFELVCFFDAHEAMGATGTRHSLRPLIVEGGSHRQQLERDPRCGMVDLYLISEIVSTSSSRRRPGSITTGLDESEVLEQRLSGLRRDDDDGRFVQGGIADGRRPLRNTSTHGLDQAAAMR